jgi:hypothetical protein
VSDFEEEVASELRLTDTSTLLKELGPISEALRGVSSSASSTIACRSAGVVEDSRSKSRAGFVLVASRSGDLFVTEVLEVSVVVVVVEISVGLVVSSDASSSFSRLRRSRVRRTPRRSRSKAKMVIAIATAPVIKMPAAFAGMTAPKIDKSYISELLTTIATTSTATKTSKMKANATISSLSPGVRSTGSDVKRRFPNRRLRAQQVNPA